MCIIEKAFSMMCVLPLRTSSSSLTLNRIWISFGGAQFLFRIQVIIAEEHKNHRHINNESKKLKNALMLN